MEEVIRAHVKDRFSREAEAAGFAFASALGAQAGAQAAKKSDDPALLEERFLQLLKADLRARGKKASKLEAYVSRGQGTGHVTPPTMC